MDQQNIRAVQATPMDVRALARWAGVVVPAAAFLGDLATSYLFAYWVCESGRAWILHDIHLVALLLIAGSAMLATWGRIHADGHSLSPADEPQRLLGRIGFWSCLLFALAVVALAIPRLFLDPCAQY